MYEHIEEMVPERIVFAEIIIDSKRQESQGLLFFRSPDRRKVNVILNDSLLPFSDVTETKLNDGDRIFLIPLYSGG